MRSLPIGPTSLLPVSKSQDKIEKHAQMKTFGLLQTGFYVCSGFVATIISISYNNIVFINR